MACLTSNWPIELLAGHEIRQAIQSQPHEIRHKTILELKKLLADVDRDTPPISTLDKYFAEHQKPLHKVRSKTGCAPADSRWICPLCPNRKHIKTRTNDLRRHLERRHQCEKSEVHRVFDPKDPKRLWEYFGPCTEEQAAKNGWEVGSFETRKSKKTKLAASAIAGVTAPLKKVIGKRKKSATSESEQDSDMESSRELLDSLKLDSGVEPKPQAPTINTDFDGSTVVPRHTTSSAAETFRSPLQSILYSPPLNPTESLSHLMAPEPLTNSLGQLGEQFQTSDNGMIPGPVQTDDVHSLEMRHFIENYWGHSHGENVPAPLSHPTTLNPMESLMDRNVSPFQIPIDIDLLNWDFVDTGDLERNLGQYHSTNQSNNSPQAVDQGTQSFSASRSAQFASIIPEQ